MIQLEAEEFEQGAWVADLVDADAFAGSFVLGGDTWVGTAVQSRVDFNRNYTRVIGGANKLATVLQDRWYAGNASLQVAVSDICKECGESFGSATPGVFLNTYQRIKGTAAQALDQLAQLFGQIWWIGRDGKVNMAVTRPTGAPADGTRLSSDTDASALLAEPSGVQLGVSYLTGAQQMAQIRHVRWNYTPERTTAQIYPLPFLFRPPVQTAYDRVYSARVDRDNGDGTIDVIADARFGVTKVPLLCGVPHSKVKVDGGDAVALAFFGGDPQKPFALLMGQDETATKQVARKTDGVTSSMPDDSVFWTWLSAAGTALNGIGVTAPVPTSLGGHISGGSDRLKVGD
jgi:hypothetical protein